MVLIGEGGLGFLGENSYPRSGDPVLTVPTKRGLRGREISPGAILGFLF